jgi:chemotaxis protein methyltransferase CheR
MLAADAFGSSDPPVSIVATDISEAALERGRRGQYRGRTVRTLDDRMRSRHFVEAGDCLQVRPHLRRLVEFQRHNLVQEGPPRYADNGFDLIACRNVLIYFGGETVERAIESLERALAPGGMLVLGAADRLCGSARRLAHPRVEARRTLSAPAKAVMRRPLGRDREAAPSDLATALEAANAGSLDAAVEITSELLREDALNADAYFVRGMAELGLGDTAAAVSSLRRALYVDPTFGLAAFKLGRAHEQRGDEAAAARAYEQALHTIEAGDTRHEAILDQVDLGDVAGACALRLARLRGGRV